MNVLKIEPSNHKPGVFLDPDTNTIEFCGASFPEDAISFFTPVIRWLNEYSNLCDDRINSGIRLNVTFDLTYLNSASHRAFLEIFFILKKMMDKGMAITVDWKYEKFDARILECGQELSELASVPVNFIEYD